MNVKHQPLIASYKKDFPWLYWFLHSFEKFATGYLKPVVVVPSADIKQFSQVSHLCELKVKDGPGFGRAQVVMMQGDLFCPEADYIHLFGSDNFVSGPTTPDMFFKDDKPVMFYDTPRSIVLHEPDAFSWLGGTHRALGWEPHGEFMRQLPLVYPRQLYAPVRSYIQKIHRIPFEKYVIGEVNGRRKFSESNVLGEYAWVHFRDSYQWICLENEGADYKQRMQPNPVLQFWSHGGLDKPSAALEGLTPRQIITKVLQPA